MCFGNISKDLTVINMKKTGLYRYVYDFSVYYNTIDVRDIVDIHKYLMKKRNIMFDFIKQAFISFLSFTGLLARVATFSYRTKCISRAMLS